MSSLFFGYRLGGKGRSLGRNFIRNDRRSRCCKCYISPIEKALHGYTHGGRDLFDSRTIYGERFGLFLKKKKNIYIYIHINTYVKTKGTINYMRQTKDKWQREHVQRKKKEK